MCGVRAFAILLLYYVGFSQGDLVLTASPTAILPGVTSDLVLRCSLTSDNMDPSMRVLALQIEKLQAHGGVNLQGLASISLGDSDARLDHNEVGLAVEGHIPMSSPLDSYIQLNISNPSSKDSGVYVCAISALASSLLVNEKANITIVETELSSDPQLAILLHELQKMRNDITALSQQISDCGCGGGGGGSRGPSQAVSFTARPAQKRPFRTGQRMTFDAVDVNIGGHYDPATGTFTAPVNGSYVIMASLSIQEAKTLTDLIVNYERKGQLVTSDDDQTSISLVLSLHPGDEVWLQGAYNSHNTSATNVFADQDTVFSGFLLDQY